MSTPRSWRAASPRASPWMRCSASADLEDRGRRARRWTERAAGNGHPDGGSERRAPSPMPGGPLAHPALGDVPRHDEVGAHEPAPGRDESPQQRGRHGERRVGDDAKGSAGEPEIRGVGAHDRDRRVCEPIAELLRASRMQLDREHACARGDERLRQRTAPGADVEHELAGQDRCGRDEPLRPLRVEPVPPPPDRSSPSSRWCRVPRPRAPRSPGHDAPSPWSLPQACRSAAVGANEFSATVRRAAPDRALTAVVESRTRGAHGCRPPNAGAGPTRRRGPLRS